MSAATTAASHHPSLLLPAAGAPLGRRQHACAEAAYRRSGPRNVNLLPAAGSRRRRQCSCKGALPLRQLEVAARRRHLRSSGVPWSSSARLLITRQQYVLGSADS
jgi:hypothetical protein